MKELTIEEKARAYDEAKLRMSAAYNSNRCTIGFMNEIFPEFKDSEDERIKKELITYLSTVDDKELIPYESWITWLEKQSNTNEPINRDKFAQAVLRGAAINLIIWIDYNAAEGNMCLSNMECKDIEDSLVSGNWDKIYAYIKKKLEKQGEQKADDKIKPKFQNGQWIVWQNKYYNVNDNGCGYELIDQNDLSTSLEYGTIDENAHLWDVIEDARDGDVLTDKYNNIGIFQECEGIRWHSYIYLGCDGELRGFSIGGSHEQTDTHPATKEQRDTLFTKMKEADYEWDANKKELRKIEQIPVCGKEDGKIRKALISILKSDFEKDTTIYDISVGDIIAWLEKQGKKPTDKIEKHV